MKKKKCSSRKEKLKSKRHLPFYLFYSSFAVASSPKVKTNLWPIRRVLLYNVLRISRPNFFSLAQIKSSLKTLPPQTYLREEWSKPYSTYSQTGRQTREPPLHPYSCQSRGTLAVLASDPGPATPSAPCPGLPSASADDVWECLKGELGLSWTLAASFVGLYQLGNARQGNGPICQTLSCVLCFRCSGWASACFISRCNTALGTLRGCFSWAVSLGDCED